MATEEEKKANQAARDAIKVVGTKQPDAPDPAADIKAANEAANKEEEVIEEVIIEEVIEEVAANEEEIEDLEEEKDEAKTEKDKARIQKRIDKLTAKNKTLADENASLKAQLAAKPDDEKALTQEDVERLAAQKVTEREFEQAVNRIADSAAKFDKGFKTKINALAEEIGSPIPGQMIGILDDLPNNGADVLLYLAKEENQDEAEEIWKLSPAKMALKLSKISDKIKPKKQISKVPAPNEALKGRGTSPDVLNPKNMDEFVRIRAQQAEAFRKRKMGLTH